MSDETLYKFLQQTETAHQYFLNSCQTISRLIDKIEILSIYPSSSGKRNQAENYIDYKEKFMAQIILIILEEQFY